MLFCVDLNAVSDGLRTVHGGERRLKSVPEGAVLHLPACNVFKGNLGAGEQKARHDTADVRLLLRVRF